MELNELRKTRGEQLKAQREVGNISKSQLSRRSGISRSTIDRIENGEGSWNIDTELLYIKHCEKNIKCS